MAITFWAQLTLVLQPFLSDHTGSPQGLESQLTFLGDLIAPAEGVWPCLCAGRTHTHTGKALRSAERGPLRPPGSHRPQAWKGIPPALETGPLSPAFTTLPHNPDLPGGEAKRQRFCSPAGELSPDPGAPRPSAADSPRAWRHGPSRLRSQESRR